MGNQHGFVITRGMIAIIALLMLGLIVWIIVSSSSPSRQDTATIGQGPEGQAQQTNAQGQEVEKNTQVKEDLARVATAVAEYVSHNSGAYPANGAQLDEVLTKYILNKPFLSPITQNSYTMTLGTVREQGVMNLERGTCNANKNGVVPTENTRTYALLTPLVDKSVYCIDI